MKTDYTKRKDGEGFTAPNGQPYKPACCDCGLVHQIVVLAYPLPFGFAARRDNRATAQRRRHLSK